MINGSVINGVIINAAGDGATVITEDVLETAVIANPASLIETYLLITDTAVVTDNDFPDRRASFLSDAAVVTSAFDILRTAKLTVRDDVGSADATYGARIVLQDVSDSAVITDAADSGAPGLTVRDSAVVTSAPLATVTARVVVRDTFKGFAEPAYAGSLVVRDTLVGTDTVTSVAIPRLVVRDSAVVTSTTDDGATNNRVVDVTETASITGEASTRLQARNDYRVTGYILDRLVSTDGILGTDGLGADTVWTASVASWGMSRHTGVGITQRGGRYAVSPQGLYEVGEGYSPATIDTGFRDFGSKSLKHIPTVYWQGERDGDLTLIVTADRRGVRATNSYLPFGRAQDKSRSIRVEIGRGYRSTYYKFQVNTTDRAEIFGGEAAVVNTERRI